MAISKIFGVAIADIAKINGVSKASVSSFGGETIPAAGTYPVYESSGTMVAKGADVIVNLDTIDVNYPADIAVNDILIAHVLISVATTFTVPSGWTLIAEENSSAQSTASMYKRADGTEIGTLAFVAGIDLVGTISGIMHRFSGCVTSGTPYESLNVTASALIQNTSYSNPSNSLGNNRLAVIATLVEDNTTETNITTTGYTLQDRQSSGEGSDSKYLLHTQNILNSATPDGTIIWETANVDYTVYVAFYLIPA